jgi:hypothetical protein
VRDDLQEEIPVAASVDQLSGRRATQGKSAQHKRPRLKRELLSLPLSLLADQQDGFDLLQPRRPRQLIQ